MTASAPPPSHPASRRLLTSEEFLDWLEPGRYADLIDGKIIIHSRVNLRHARLVNFMDRLLSAYLEHKDLGELHREHVAVRLDNRTTFMPDLGFFTKAQVGRLTETHAPFAPTFVVEVLSPATSATDRGPKFPAYERHHVHEYWILDPEKLDHRFYRREGDLLTEFADSTDRIESWSVPGFWVKRLWLNSEPHPPIAKCLADILGGRKRKTSSSRH